MTSLPAAIKKRNKASGVAKYYITYNKIEIDLLHLHNLVKSIK